MSICVICVENFDFDCGGNVKWVEKRNKIIAKKK